MDIEEMTALLTRWVRPETHAVVVAAGAADGDGFPHVEGIDRECATRRLGQDRSMFIELLRMFVADNADAAVLARAELLRGERTAAARRMHTLRSNAGFIGAMALMEAATGLERAIDAGDDGLDERLAALGQQIDALVEASAPWC
jgi:HPt (histidine-containing phosphotransfer) domain-containing protein